jgi:hypothetical protein
MQTKIRARWTDTISSRLRDHGTAFHPASALPRSVKRTRRPMSLGRPCRPRATAPLKNAGSCCAGHDSAFRRPLMGTPPKQPGPAGKFASASTGQTVHSLFFPCAGMAYQKCDVGVPPHLCMGQLTQVKGVGGFSPAQFFFLLK